ALIAVAMFATSRLNHESIATGAMGMLFPILVVPVLCLAFVVWAVASRRLSDGTRRATMVVSILLACGVWTLVRTDGFSGDFQNDLKWRWTKTSEERFLARVVADAPAPVTPPTAPEVPAKEASAKPVVVRSGGSAPARLPQATAETAPEWRGFRGPG